MGDQGTNAIAALVLGSAVAVLLFRAREGLRQAYLAEHVRDTGDKACSRVAPHLPAYVRGRLTPRRQRVVEEHVDECSRCRVAVLDLTQINDDLGAVLTPAVLLGVTGAAAGPCGWAPGTTTVGAVTASVSFSRHLKAYEPLPRSTVSGRVVPGARPSTSP